MQALNTFPRVKGDTCLEVSIGSSFLNILEAVEHLVAIARAHPPPALYMSPRYQKLASTSSSVPSTSTWVIGLPSIGRAWSRHLGHT